jgi:hypothetical protein
VRRDTPKSREFLRRGRESSARSLGQIRRVKRPTEQTQREARLRARFAAEKFVQGRCAACGYDAVVNLEVHHAIGKQLLRRLLGKKGAPCPLEVLWDPDNALVLGGPRGCNCHAAHELAMRRVPQSVLRPENWAFADRHGLRWVLETTYLPEAKAA